MSKEKELGYLFVFSDPQGSEITDEVYHEWYDVGELPFAGVNGQSISLLASQPLASIPPFGTKQSMHKRPVSRPITSTISELFKLTHTRNCLRSVPNWKQKSLRRST